MVKVTQIRTGGLYHAVLEPLRSFDIGRTFTLPRIVAAGLLAVLVILSVAHPLDAQSVTEGYNSDQQLQRGMLVQLKKGDASKVEAVTQANGEQLHGVVVNANDSPVTIAKDGQRIYVATVGQYDVLVSDQNGAIAIGDYITVSAIAGIGMKVDAVQPTVVGKATVAFDGKSGVLSSTEVKDSTGATHKINIGRVTVDIGVGSNPLQKPSQPNVPQFLLKAASSIAGKPVSVGRIYTAVVVFIVSTIASSVLMYGGVRSGIISIGRNPLSKKSIVRGMIQVILVGLTIFISGVFGVYLLLKL